MDDHNTQISRLSSLLSAPKPGIEVQKKMSPVTGDVNRYYEIPEDAKKAGVLLMLYKSEGEWHTAFMKRTSNEKDKHSGQISFPGGRYKKSDLTVANCALRETEEELGVPGREVRLIGELSQLYVYASNHIVFPHVGVLEYEPDFQIDKTEVKTVIQAPISYFGEDIVRYKDLSVRGFKLREVPYYDLYGEVLWGATAMMMSEFLNIWEKLDV